MKEVEKHLVDFHTGNMKAIRSWIKRLTDKPIDSSVNRLQQTLMSKSITTHTITPNQSGTPSDWMIGTLPIGGRTYIYLTRNT